MRATSAQEFSDCMKLTPAPGSVQHRQLARRRRSTADDGVSDQHDEEAVPPDAAVDISAASSRTTVGSTVSTVASAVHPAILSVLRGWFLLESAGFSDSE